MENEENQQLSKTNQFHLIDDQSNFQGGIDQYFQNCDLIQYKRNYNIVSIIGSQSSGKSTLLNNLFGTEFQVMNSKVKRGQTTKGIYVSRDKDIPLLILDVEGTDSVERWDDRQFYAKSTGIFALALSQVLVINIWTNMLGNYEGQQLGIIKTIFEMNLKLFGVDSTKSIVFVLRDFDPDENIEQIKQEVFTQLDKIWQEINKPQQYQDKHPQDLFNIEFYTLSSFKLQKDQFLQEVNNLRERFINKDSENYYFKNYDYSTNLPLDSLNDYISNIWDTIKNEKDINLPNEKEIVAQIRCEQIKKEALQQSDPILQQLSEIVKQKICENFNEIGLKGYQAAVTYYESKADYFPSVVEEKKQELQIQLLNQLYSLFVSQISQTKNKIQIELDSNLSFNENIGGIDFQIKKIKDIQQNAVQQATSILLNSIVVNNDIWQKEQVDQELKTIIENKIEAKFKFVISKYFNEDIDNNVYKAYNQFDNTFWQQAQDCYDQNLKQIQVFLDQIQLSLVKKDLIQKEFNNLIYEQLEKKIKEKQQNIVDHMVKRFSQIFKHKESGIPENWKNLEEAQIEEKFIKSKDTVLQLLKQFTHNQIIIHGQEKSFNPALSDIRDNRQKIDNQSKSLEENDKPRLINEIQMSRIQQEFEKLIKEELESAIRSKNQTDILGIPKAFWAILIFFAYDDIFRMLSNPFLMTPLIMVLGAIGLAFSTGNQQLVYSGAKMGYKMAQDKIGKLLK